MGWKRQPEISGLELSCGVPHPSRVPSPQEPSRIPAPHMLDKAQGSFLYDFLCTLNSASVWDERFPFSGGEKESVFNAFKKILSCFCGENKFMAGN